METQSLYQASDYRSVLRSIFDERKSRRPAYSLNSFARDIGTTSSRLSAVFKGRYGISATSARDIAAKLKFSDEQTEIFLALVISQNGRSDLERKQASNRLHKLRSGARFKKVDVEMNLLYSKWYYSAVQVLISLSEKKLDLAEIARSLRITKIEAADALTLLQKLKLIESKNGYSIKRDEVIISDNPVPNHVIRQFHSQVLDEAKNSLARLPIEKRKFRSTIFSFDSSRVAAARQWLDRMHEEFMNEFGVSQSANSVYAIGIQLFRLDEENTGAL